MPTFTLWKKNKLDCSTARHGALRRGQVGRAWNSPVAVAAIGQVPIAPHSTVRDPHALASDFARWR